jgi:hypothetical protein
MKKKFLLVLILTAVITTGAFAQDFDSMPKNTIVADIGPTIIGISIARLGEFMGGASGINTTGFGLALQYERLLMPKFAVAGKIGYLGGGIGYTDNFSSGYVTTDTSLGIDISSITFEAHARFYPGSNTFFLDGMLGFANLTTKFSGTFKAYDNTLGGNYADSIDISTSRTFFNLGAKYGWRINFGNQRGFTFEPSFGYYLAVPLTKETFGEQFLGKAANAEKPFLDAIDAIFWYLEDFIFIGGPRICLAFGWRF